MVTFMGSSRWRLTGMRTPEQNFADQFFESFVLTDPGETVEWFARLSSLLEMASVHTLGLPGEFFAAFLRSDLLQVSWKAEDMLTPETWKLIHSAADLCGDSTIGIFELPIFASDQVERPFGEIEETLARIRVPTGTSWKEFRGSEAHPKIPPHLWLFSNGSAVERAVATSESARWAYVYDSNDAALGGWFGYRTEDADEFSQFLSQLPVGGLD